MKQAPAEDMIQFEDHPPIEYVLRQSRYISNKNTIKENYYVR